MRCPTCGAENRAGRRFCLACGHDLWTACPACGARNETAAGFCGDCGAHLGAPAAPAPGPTAPGTSAPPYDPTAGLERLVPKEFAERLRATRGRVEAERRLVTILFCDVKGSTAMAEALDPEDVLEIMNGAFEHLIAPVYRHEGTLAQLLGDAILAFFGAPIGHEDDPHRQCLEYAAMATSGVVTEAQRELFFRAGRVLVEDLGAEAVLLLVRCPPC